MNKIKVRDFYNNTMFFIVSLIFFLYTSCYIGKNTLLVNFITYSCLFLSFTILFLFILKFKFNRFNISIILFFVVLLISTAFSEDGDINIFTKSYVPILAYILYLENSIILNFKNVIKKLSTLLFLLVFINFLTIIFFKNGLYADNLYAHNWFLKYDNMHSFIYFPALATMYLDININNSKKYKFIILFIIITFCILYCFSANTVMALILFCFLILFNKYFKKANMLNSKNYLIINLVAFFSIVIIRIQTVFYWIIVNVFHKSYTFSDRINIWDKVIEYVKAKPLIGYGLEKDNLFIKKMESIYYTHAHNTFLDIMYKCGIIAFTIYMYIIILVTKKLYKYRNTKEANFISIIFFCLLSMCLFEAREDKIGLYIILLLGYHINVIIENKNIENT